MFLSRFVCSASLFLFACGCSESAPSPGDAQARSGPATEATVASEPPFEMLDLETFDRLPDAKPPIMRSATMLMYEAPGKAVECFVVLKEKLAAAHWREIPGGNQSAEYDSANGFFRRGNHALTLSLHTGREPDTVSVTMQHHGDLDFAKLPLPKDADSVYRFPHTAGYVTAASVEETTKGFGDAMAVAGWTVLESSPGSTTYQREKQAVQVAISAAPAQGGKTMIQLTPQLLPVDLPVPPRAEGVRFSHQPVGLTFQYPGDGDEVAKFYQTELPRRGWTPTTESLVKNENDAFQIYRNDEKALTELKVETRGDRTHAKLEYQSPTVFAENEKRFEEFRKKQEAEKGK